MFKRMINRVLGKIPLPVPAPGALSPPSPPVTSNSSPRASESSIPDETSQRSLSELCIDLEADLGGGKGWPTYASVVLYHKPKGLIVVGTEIGSIYVYGDGFQYMCESTGTHFKYSKKKQTMFKLKI